MHREEGITGRWELDGTKSKAAHHCDQPFSNCNMRNVNPPGLLQAFATSDFFHLSDDLSEPIHAEQLLKCLESIYSTQATRSKNVYLKKWSNSYQQVFQQIG